MKGIIKFWKEYQENRKRASKKNEISKAINSISANLQGVNYKFNHSEQTYILNSVIRRLKNKRHNRLIEISQEYQEINQAEISLNDPRIKVD